MATGTLFPSPWFTAEDANGATLPGAKGYFYLAGTTTPTTTYSDVALTTPNANPVIADGSGRMGPIYLASGSYRFDLYTSGDVLVRSLDNIPATPTAEVDIDVAATAGEALTAGQWAYVSRGDGGKTVGRWYLTDADLPYASTGAGLVGLVPTAIASGATGTIRLMGRGTNATPVTPGLSYYLSGTAGAITSTAPANARFVGVADSGTTLVLSPNPNVPTQENGVNDFRLTLTTAVPVTTADVTAATTIYWTPYKGNRIDLYDATGVASRYTSAQISIAVPATTSQMYDIFVYANAGVPTLELLAWTNDTTRATALVMTTTGTYTKSGDLTRRYVGSFRTTTVSGQTEDSFAKRFLWNYSHRVRRVVRVTDGTDSWNYTIGTFRQANANPANQVAIVIGVAEALLDIDAFGCAFNNTTVVTVTVAVGEDSTTTVATGSILHAAGTTGAAGSSIVQPAGHLKKYPAVGYHFYAWLERSDATGGTTTWYGDAGTTFIQSGLHGELEG